MVNTVEKDKIAGNAAANRKNKMETMKMGKLVADMSIPMMLSLLIQSLYNIVDSIFVSRLSEEALTAVSFAYPIQMLMISVGVGTAVGLNAVLSKTLGAKKFKEASNIAATGVLLAVLSSFIFLLAGFFASGKIAIAMAKEGEIARQCQTYLFICMVFSTGNMVSMMYQRLMQATGKTILSMVILITGAVTNIILDPILIFGIWGFPALGIKGAAIATVIGQWISMFTGIVLQITCNREVSISIKNFYWNWEDVRHIYKVGFPTILTQAMQSMMVTGVNAILRPFSSSAVAFFGVYYKLQMFLFMPMNGLGQASIPIIAYNLGAGNKKRMQEAVKTVYPAAAMLAICGSIIFEAIPGQLLGLFAAGDTMKMIGVPAIRTLAPLFAVMAVTMISGYIASGLQDGITNMASAFLRQFIPLLPCAYFFASRYGIEKVWFAFWISEFTALVYAVIRIKKHLKRIR